MSAYVNIHGEPSSVSARDAVLAILPDAVCAKGTGLALELWVVRKSARRFSRSIGTGANEEAAWRDAWSRMLADDIAKGVRP
jgi:hypothetical protein